MSVLSAYNTKRDFSKTREPRGAAGAAVDGTFVVQKHAASRLHYDFRLGIGGVLKSWAVTKGPSLDPGERRLAVRTEDHPAGYANFEGTIPEGEYGGGTVMVWDRGTFSAEGDAADGLKQGKLKLALAGSRLKGGFALVRMGGKAGREKRENWLLIKERDGLADRGARLGRAEDRSALSGRTMQEIAAGVPEREARRPGQAHRTGKPAAPRLSKRDSFVKPQLATLVDEAPEGEGWIFETKFDGYRLVAACHGKAIRCFTRSGQDWTDRMPGVAGALALLNLRDCLLDGELVVLDDHGVSDFGALQASLKMDPQALSLAIFDILRLRGKDLRPLPFAERRERLEKALPDLRAPLHLSECVTGEGAKVVAAACRQGLEGVVAKRLDAAYVSRRTRDWLKIKCGHEQEFVIGGWSPSKRGRAFSSLLLGLHDEGKLRYAGRVGTGFDADQLRDLADRLRSRSRKTPPFDRVPAAVRRRARWVTPDLVAQVRFAEMTRDGAVRHAVFAGLREDKDAGEVVRERAAAAPASQPKRRGKAT